MGNRDGKTDMAHAFTSYNAFRDKLTVLINSCLTRANTTVFSIMWVNVLDRSEDTLTEQPITFGFLGTIVNGLGLGNLTMTPFQNVCRACYCEADCIEVGNISTVRLSSHYSFTSSSSAISSPLASVATTCTPSSLPPSSSTNGASFASTSSS